jgi:hypothetical protein
MQRVHWDPEFARRSGNPTTFDYGRMRETWLIHLCTDWTGDDAWLWRLDCRFRRFNYVGDTQWLRGTVTRRGRAHMSGWDDALGAVTVDEAGPTTAGPPVGLPMPRDRELLFVHGTDAIPEDDFVVDGTYKRAVGMDGNFVREGYGLGLGVPGIANYVTFLSSTTPIDEESVHVGRVFTAPRASGPDAVTTAAESFCDGVSRDIPVWENKVYRERPVPTRSERPIIDHRRWARQFYSDYDAADEVTESEA